jgi:hypothetical protein
MKRLINVLLFALIFGVGHVSAQYQMILQNAVQTSATVFQFDVYIVSTGANFNLTSYGMKLACNSTIVNGGALTFAYVASSAGISITPLIATTASSGGVTYLIAASSVGSQTVSTTPLKVGTFQITNTVAFGVTPAALTWDFSTPFPTLVNINSADATVQASHINALAPYQVTLQNDTQVNGTTYEFDAVIVRTTADFTLTSCQMCFTYNSAAANGGTLTFTYVGGSTAFTAFAPQTSQNVMDGITPNFVCGSTNGAQAVSTTPLRIGRFRVTNTVTFGAVPMNIAWDFAGLYTTQINISSSNVTLPANHLNNLVNSPLPIELVSFIGRNANDKVLLNWKTATEINNYGFDIQRKSENAEWQKIDFLAGSGNSNVPREYSYADKNPIAGNVQYRLRQIDISGQCKYYDAIEVAVAAPKEYKLMQNSPNPFNPTTAIKYQMPVAGFVTITIYDMLGREVASLVNEMKQPGSYSAEWNGRDSRGAAVTSGVYIYRLAAGGFVDTKKMNFLK